MSQLQRDSRAVSALLTYDANNLLLVETKAENNEATTTYTYNGFNQLIALTVDGTDVAYAYNAQGIRTAKRVNNLRTAYLLDGGNVVAEVQNNAVTENYLRGANLIRRTSSSETGYYLFNAHGDVVTTTNLNGTINQEYDYDAFGNEKDPDDLDSNPFRYCGEYLDAETGTYYLRARYYDPTIGRFTQQDTHWNTANMIYGDNPQKINEHEDKLGLKTYSYVPQIGAVMQSGNQYVYGVNNPVMFVDQDGHIAFMIVTALAGMAIGGVIGAIQSYNKYGEVHWQNVAIGAGIGGAIGLGGGAVLAYFAAGTATASTSAVFAAFTALIKGGTSATLWGVSRDGINQGIRHFFEYATKYPKRISQIAQKLGYESFEISTKGFELFTEAVMNVVKNYAEMGGIMRTIGSKALYYYNDVVIITYNGKLQSVMIASFTAFQKLK